MPFLRGLSFRAFPFRVLQPFPDGGLCLSLLLTPAAIVDHPVDHIVVVLNGHFSGAEGIALFRLRGNGISLGAGALFPVPALLLGTVFYEWTASDIAFRL